MENNNSQSIIVTLNNVAKELSKSGFHKDKTNKKQDYAYRSIDGLYDLVSSIFAINGLIIIPKIQEHSKTLIGKTLNGNDNYLAIVKVEYKIAHIYNNQYEIAQFYGEAIDTSDKATNKAATAAYKYMLLQLFAIPINGTDGDADNESPENKSSEDIMPASLKSDNLDEPSSSKSPKITQSFVKDLYEIKRHVIPKEYQIDCDAFFAGKKDGDLVKIYNYLLKQ